MKQKKVTIDLVGRTDYGLTFTIEPDLFLFFIHKLKQFEFCKVDEISVNVANWLAIVVDLSSIFKIKRQ